MACWKGSPCDLFSGDFGFGCVFITGDVVIDKDGEMRWRGKRKCKLQYISYQGRAAQQV